MLLAAVNLLIKVTKEAAHRCQPPTDLVALCVERGVEAGVAAPQMEGKRHGEGDRPFPVLFERGCWR